MRNRTITAASCGLREIAGTAMPQLPPSMVAAADWTLCNPKFYIDVKNEEVVQGTSAFWQLAESASWRRTDAIAPKSQNLVATVALELPSFAREFFAAAYGTITYEIGERNYQTPVESVMLSAEETIDGPYALKFSMDIEQSVLAIKSVSFERTVIVELQSDPGRGARILEFLNETSFQEVCPRVYVVMAPGSLMYSLIEALPTDDGEASLRISTRSIVQMNILLRLLRDEFPDIAVKEEDGNCVAAAMALIEELELHLSGANAAKIQRAKMYTDLHIP
ncbi:hypothetical protein KM043_001319 [Ampulex compressa]|nr:hypothetical protein KM043_001319 [Ampulex compressa]